MSANPATTVQPQLPYVRATRFSALAFGACVALVAFLYVDASHLQRLNDFYGEAWPAYRLLFHGRFVAFLRRSPAYGGSLLLRAPYALLASALGASPQVVYAATAIPCLLTPALLAGHMAAARRVESAPSAGPRSSRSLRPVDLFIISPPVMIAIVEGHPEEALGAVLCVLAVLLACRGSGRAAGLALGIALINKSWAIVAVPLVVALLPADQRLRGIVTLLATAGAVMVPDTLLRAASLASAGTSLGAQNSGIFLIPQLWWWFGRKSWLVREAHILLVLTDWLVTVVWWYARAHSSRRIPNVAQALAMLALVLFLRAALDPWDNAYYLAPFMLAVAVYEDRPGFPRLTWLCALAILVTVVPDWQEHGLPADAQAAAFSVFALITIAWFGRLAFRSSAEPDALAYAAAPATSSPG